MNNNLEKLKDLTEQLSTYPTANKKEIHYICPRGAITGNTTKVSPYLTVDDCTFAENTEFFKHDHKDNEWILVLQGSLSVSFNGVEHIVPGGKCISIPRKTSHSLYSTHGCKCYIVHTFPEED